MTQETLILGQGAHIIGRRVPHKYLNLLPLLGLTNISHSFGATGSTFFMLTLFPAAKKILQEALATIGAEPTTTSHQEKLISAVGAFLGIAATYWVSHWYLDSLGALMMLASMGASAVLLFAVPHGALSQPWPVVGGHLVSAFMGISCYKVLGNSFWAAPLAVGLAVASMHYLRCIHPPGGATALTAVIGGEVVYALGFKMMLFPVFINVLVILSIAIVFNSPFKWRRYPSRFVRREQTAPHPPGHHPRLTQEDFAAAMQELNSLLDVTPEDLAQLFELAATHAQQKAAHPAEILPGHFYSNGRLGKHWEVRQVIDAAETPGQAPDKIIYKSVAGAGGYETGLCSTEVFRLWASFEVVPREGHWVRIEKGAVSPVEAPKL